MADADLSAQKQAVVIAVTNTVSVVTLDQAAATHVPFVGIYRTGVVGGAR